MKIQFDAEEQMLHIEDGTVDRYSSHAHHEGFRLELYAKKQDLDVVEKTLLSALSIFRSMKRLADGAKAMDPDDD